MGIYPDLQDFVKGLKLPEGFSVCELGSQRWHNGYRKRPEWRDGPAVDFYNKIGVGRYECIDGNKQGTIQFDLNLPWKDTTEPFDFVTDFGTAEHIMNQGEVWRTVHRLCKPGGLIMSEKPAQGYLDHGFFNYHPTFFRDLAGANGYELKLLKTRKTERGELLWALMRKVKDTSFCNPQQGKYHKTLCL
jgi:SAM-dependent methyltransferase